MSNYLEKGYDYEPNKQRYPLRTEAYSNVMLQLETSLGKEDSKNFFISRRKKLQEDMPDLARHLKRLSHVMDSRFTVRRTLEEAQKLPADTNWEDLETIENITNRIGSLNSAAYNTGIYMLAVIHEDARIRRLQLPKITQDSIDSYYENIRNSEGNEWLRWMKLTNVERELIPNLNTLSRILLKMDCMEANRGALDIYGIYQETVQETTPKN